MSSEYIFSAETKSYNPIQEEGMKQKGHLTSFSPVTSTNEGISPTKCLTFSFNPFTTLV